MKRMITIAALLPSALAAQTARISGIAWDSIAGRPLPMAFVSLGTRTAVADSTGSFVFDSLSPGSYRATLQHDRLDSLGLGVMAAQVSVRGAADTIRIATPSAGTMWRRVCPGEAPYDSGFVFGAVRAAVTRTPLVRGQVVATWIDLNRSGATVSQREYRLESTTGDDGTFVLCGLPLDANIRISSIQDTVMTAADLSLSRGTRLRRQDLTLVDLNARGVVRGVVTLKGQPVSNVRVSVGGAQEIRTGYTGRFSIPRIPAGTQVMDIQGIGFAPISQVVVVPANDTVEVTIAVDRITVLDSVIVKAPTVAMHLAREFEERRHRAKGYFKDSTQMAKEQALEGVFSGMGTVYARRPAGGEIIVQVGTPAACPSAILYVDGQRSFGRFSTLRPEDLAAIEVYRAKEMPFELAGTLGLKPPNTPCAVVAWTKLKMR